MDSEGRLAGAIIEFLAPVMVPLKLVIVLSSPPADAIEKLLASSQSFTFYFKKLLILTEKVKEINEKYSSLSPC